MTERIDHVGEAIACEEAGLSILRRHDLAPHMEAVIQFDMARLHAQLALVEQQRIANRLKLAELDLRSEVAESNAPLDFRIRPYLSAEDWESIDVEES